MKTNRENLLSILESVKPGLSSKELVEQSTCFVFKDKKVFTFNDEIAVSHPVELDIEGAVPSDKMYKLLNKMRDDEIEITPVLGGLEVKGKKIKATIKSEEEITLPLGDLSNPTEWHPVPEKFTDMIATTLLSVGRDLAKPVLTCVHWTPEIIESCDNFRLTRHTVTTEGLEKNLLIPGGSFSELSSYQPVEFSIEGSWAHFKTASDCVFACRVFDGEFVPLDSIVNKVAGETIQFPASMIEILERSSILAETDINGVAKVNVTIKDGVVTVDGSSDLGEIKETTRVRSKDVDVCFEVRAETLCHILKECSEGKIDTDNTSIRFSKDNWFHIVALS